MSLVSHAHVRRALLVAVACLLVAGPAGRASAPQPPPAQPTFRLDANFVRVDMYPTIDGRPVTDLTRDEIEIREDGVPQAIETFEHVVLSRGVPVEQRRDPSSVTQMRAEAENPRARVFVIFLDTGQTEIIGSHRMQRALVSMLDRMLAPDDLFAVMTQKMSPMDLAFARKTDTVEGYLRRHWNWGERDRLYPEDPIERRYIECYGDSLGRVLIERRREKFAINALQDLSLYLRGLREERKAVIAVTIGWLLPGEDRNLAGPGPEPSQLGTTPTGRLTTDRFKSDYGYSIADCERDRQVLAFTDLHREFYDMMEVANRGNVSIYPVDSRGLAASDSPSGGGGTIEEIRRVQRRVEYLRSLAENTDGIAIVDTNDIDRGLERIVADMTSYYLLGYYSSNTKLDGRYRKIGVRVKRPGVDVRARRGYKALSAAELGRSPSTTSAAPVGPSPEIQAALSSLVVSRTSQLRTAVGFARSTRGPVRIVAAVEVDAAAGKSDFASGGDVAVVAATSDGAVLAQKRATLVPGTRSALVDLGAVSLSDDDVVLRTRVTPKADGLPLTDSTAVGAAMPGAALIWRRGPTTGMKYVLTADRSLSRADRVRVEVPADDGSPPSSAMLLDRAGNPTSVPLTLGTRADSGLNWASGELALAPLAPGEYVIKLTVTGAGGPQDIYTGIRVTP